MPTALEVKGGVIATKRKEVADIFAKHKKEDGSYDLTAAQVEDLKSRNDELHTLGEEYDKLRDLDALEQKNKAELDRLSQTHHPSGHSGPRDGQRYGGAMGTDGAWINPPSFKSLGQRVIDHPECKSAIDARRKGGSLKPYDVDISDFDTKAMFHGSLDTKAMAETGTGYAPANYRTNIVVFSAQRRPVVGDLIPQDNTELQVIKYMLETTFTNNAAMTAEGQQAPTNAIGYTEQSQLVEWLPAILPVTEQQLEDVPSLMAIINNRLTLQLGLAEETELLSGNGTSPHLNGFLAAAGVQSYAVNAEVPSDAILKAITLVRWTGFANPTGVILHPNNWQTIRLLRTPTGTYLFGAPSETGVDRIWGLPMVVTPAITANTSLLGDFLMYSQIWRRLGLRIEIGYINDDFQRGQKTVRAQTRLALTIYRPAAFCKVTGLS